MIVDKISEIVSAPLPFILLAAGIFFAARLKFHRLLAPGVFFGALFERRSGDDAASPFRAMCLALAGTLGVGNIVGVAGALALGGFGSIFWMWVSAFLAMVLKYVETVLAVSHRRASGNGFYGGAVYYIRDVFARIGHDKIGGILAAGFSILLIFNCLTTGCIVQVNAASAALDGSLGIPKPVVGVVFALLAGGVLTTGGKNVSKLTGILIPAFSGIFIILSLAVLAVKHSEIPAAFSLIFKEAFGIRPASAGIFGFVTNRAIRFGTVRGLLSNEAGCGTSPTAHASADVSHPSVQGIFGIFEVFADTMVLCTLPALVMTVGYDQIGSIIATSPVDAAIRAYTSALGGFCAPILAVSIAVFGLSTLLCLGHYGLESLRYLFPGKPNTKLIFLIIYCGATATGAVISATTTVSLADIAIALLTTVNTAVLLISHRETERLTFEFICDRRAPRRMRPCRSRRENICRRR